MLLVVVKPYTQQEETTLKVFLQGTEFGSGSLLVEITYKAWFQRIHYISNQKFELHLIMYNAK